MAKFHIKKDDTVKVMTGESKGLEGKVLEVFPSKNKALVEGANIVKRHTKPNAANPNGGIVEKEAPIHISNLMLVDPKTGETTKVGRKEVDGKLVRYSKKSGEVIK
ncbi:MAG: 50S ribosomal protein L24 [Flavobacteriales bacterium]|nr:50S ribosomal protein L24 [Flavobacteriales bacterium]